MRYLEGCQPDVSLHLRVGCIGDVTGYYQRKSASLVIHTERRAAQHSALT